MKVIITGGTGLIGSALAEYLVRENHKVVVLSRNPQKSKRKPDQAIIIEKWDGLSASGWGHHVDGADVIVNLAGESIAGESFSDLIFKRWTPERKQHILQSRLDAGKAILEAVSAANQKPRVLIQASAVGYYGARGDEEITEDSPQGEDYLSEVCKKWEDSTAQVEELGIRRVIIRTGGVVLSTKGGAFPFMLLPFNMFVGGPLGRGNQWFAWIHLLDEIRAIHFLINNANAHGVFNLVAPQVVTNKEFSKIMGKVIRRPSYFPVPAMILRLAFGQKADFLLGSQRQVPKRLLSLGFEFMFPDPESALQNLLGK